MRYLVTGATGFIGGRLACQLLEAGHEVVTVARTPGKATDLVALGVSVHKGDITDKESLRSPMKGVDGVFHVAAWYRVGARDKSPAEHINVQGTRNVFEVMSDLGIEKGVYTSTLAVFSNTRGHLVDENYRYDGPHLSEYDRTKWAAHYEVALPMIEQGLPLVIVQPGVVYGPGDTSQTHGLWVNYLRRRLLSIPAGAAYCWGHVEDTARGHVLAMERGEPGESYIIAGPAHTIKEALDIAETITGIPAPRLQLRPSVTRSAATLAALAERVVSLPDIYTPEALRSSAGVTYIGSNKKARQELGFAPRALSDGLPEVLSYEMQRLGMSSNQSRGG